MKGCSNSENNSNTPLVDSTEGLVSLDHVGERPEHKERQLELVRYADVTNDDDQDSRPMIKAKRQRDFLQQLRGIDLYSIIFELNLNVTEIIVIKFIPVH